MNLFNKIIFQSNFVYSICLYYALIILKCNQELRIVLYCEYENTNSIL